MTRLKAGDLSNLIPGLEQYDEDLSAKTGLTLRGIACRAAGVSERQLVEALPRSQVAVVRVSSGQGIIPGFCEAVQGIIRYLGFKVFLPPERDIAGLAAAVERGAGIVLMADDDRFIALNLTNRRVVDNGEATGRGYGVALAAMAGGLKGRQVLVIGAGRVGTGAIRLLREMEAEIAVYDRDPLRARPEAAEFALAAEDDLEQALEKHSLWLDASPAPEILEARHIRSSTLLAAPGIPLGLTAQARERIGDRLIHDPLPIGVAAMTVMALGLR